MEHVIVEPSVDLLESMRSVGYSLEAAIADIVDNSIDAEAKCVDIEIDVAEGNYVAVLDDGIGMSENAAIEALRLAGNTGTDSRNRLGRFGLGMKTASLSQARCLTVITKQGNSLVALRWDIDAVRESGVWSLVRLDADEVEVFPLRDKLLTRTNGTLIIWTSLDLLLGDASDPGEFLGRQITKIAEHLSFTFHRFLSRNGGGLNVNINCVAVPCVDPFLRNNPQTQESLTEYISIGGKMVRLTAFTLPHASGLSTNERSRPDLSERMREFQGFYVYRNERLLSRGHWFGLARMNEITKQTRVMVDVPQELDDLWQIDIKKSRAEPPSSFKAHLKRIVEPMIAKGVRIHTFRGRKVGTTEINHVWTKYKDRTGFRYEINLEHPLIAATLSSLHTDQAEAIASLFQLIAERFPHFDSYQEMASNNTPSAVTSEATGIRGRLIEIQAAEVFEGDVSHIYRVLKLTEPFNTCDDLQALIEEVWGTIDGTK